MKKLTLLLVLALFISCSNSKEKQLVSNYEQRIGNTPTDLNLKFQKFEFVKNITGKDSLEYLTEYLNQKKGGKILYFEEIRQMRIEFMEEGEYKLKSANDEYGKEIWREYINKKKEDIESYDDSIALYNRTFIEPVLIKINAFKSKPDSIIAKEYNVTYTILNPFLNNAKQTLFKTYYINSDNTKILNVETKESI
jgi:hypothetical protein